MKSTNTPASRLRNGGLRRTLIGATAIGSTGAALMTANAAIVYSGPRNLSTSSLLGSSPITPDVEPVNLDGAGVDEFSLESFSTKGSDFHWTANDAPSFGTIMTTFGYHREMSAGDTIGAGDTFANGGNFIDNNSSFQGPWAAGSDGYFGYRFNPSGGQNLYGWGHVTFSADAKVMTLVDWAYENTGAPIAAGAVPTLPEPTTSFLLAAGLTVAALWRRRAKPAGA